MYSDLKKELRNNQSSLIILKDSDILRFKMEDLKILMTLLKEDPEFLKGSIILDKVVGKCVAALMILGRVKEVYTNIISEQAVELFSSYKVKFHFQRKVPFIKNKEGIDLCPMELLVFQFEYPTEIYVKLNSLLSDVPSDLKGWSKIFR